MLVLGTELLLDKGGNSPPRFFKEIFSIYIIYIFLAFYFNKITLYSLKKISLVAKVKSKQHSKTNPSNIYIYIYINK